MDDGTGTAIIDGVRVSAPEGLEQYTVDSEYASVCAPGTVSEKQFSFVLPEDAGIVTVTPDAAGAYALLASDAPEGDGAAFLQSTKEGAAGCETAEVVVGGQDGVAQGFDVSVAACGRQCYSAHVLVPHHSGRLLEIRISYCASDDGCVLGSLEDLLGLDSIDSLLSGISFL